AKESGGEYASGSKTRPREVRRAGSVKTASKPLTSTSATSAQRTSISPARPSAAALASATAQVSGSRSTPRTEIPTRASAIASPPGGQRQLLARLVLTQLGQQGLALVGQQGPERFDLHQAIVVARRGIEFRKARATPLALWLTEC